MTILSFKPGHDGTVACIQDGKLLYSFEAEKDSFPRYSWITPSIVMDALERVDVVPDVFAVSGWIKGPNAFGLPIESGYSGHDTSSIQVYDTKVMGHQVKRFTSSHERSHVMGVYGMSPFPQGMPCYLLIWEGTLGAFYEIDEDLNVIKLGDVMDQPGQKYSLLYGLANPIGEYNAVFTSAGKLMALAAFSDRSAMNADEEKIVNYIIEKVRSPYTRKEDMAWSKYHNIGVEHDDLKQVAGKLSDRIFDIFHAFAEKHCNKGYPLLIGGGCGLNCEWNTKWKNSGLFSDIFIPPVTNDTGSALGTAVDAYHHLTGKAKIEWDMYAGIPFDNSGVVNQDDDFHIYPLDYQQLCELLMQDKVFAMVQGNCEIGPRALGNRSLIAAPFSAEMHAKLNRIKQRESYRPIAPMCLLEDVSEHFDWEGPSPYMLYFQHVKSPNLKAITHVDGSARVQTVDKQDNPGMYELLQHFKSVSGFGVLCNTSLNFNGRGFINNYTDLKRYVMTTDVSGFICEGRLYVKRDQA